MKISPTGDISTTATRAAFTADLLMRVRSVLAADRVEQMGGLTRPARRSTRSARTGTRELGEIIAAVLPGVFIAQQPTIGG